MLTDPDEAVHKVMAGLRGASASPALEQRIMRAMRDHSDSPRPAIWRRFAIPAFAGCILLAALMVLGGRMSHLTKTPAYAGIQHLPQPEVAGATTSTVPTTVTHATKKAVRRGAPAMPLPASAARVSFPAPPMPLTEQERLLLHVAHHHDPAKLGMLIPASQAVDIAAEQAQFDKFFAPPPPLRAEAPIPSEVIHEGETR